MAAEAKRFRPIYLKEIGFGAVFLWTALIGLQYLTEGTLEWATLPLTIRFGIVFVPLLFCLSRITWVSVSEAGMRGVDPWSIPVTIPWDEVREARHIWIFSDYIWIKGPRRSLFMSILYHDFPELRDEVLRVTPPDNPVRSFYQENIVVVNGKAKLAGKQAFRVGRLG